MSEIAGFDITPNSGTTLRKVLKLNLGEHMEQFEGIRYSYCLLDIFRFASHYLRSPPWFIGFQADGLYAMAFYQMAMHDYSIILRSAAFEFTVGNYNTP